MVKLCGIKGKQGNHTIFQSTISYIELNSLLKTMDLEVLREIGVSNYNLARYSNEIINEFPQLIIVINEKNIMYDNVGLDISTLPNAYKSAFQAFAFISAKNKSGYLLKGLHVLEEYAEKLKGSQAIDTNQEFPIEVLVRNNNESLNDSFCLLNGLGLSKEEDEIAFALCNDGILSIKNGNFKFIDYGKAISTRSSSVTLFNNVLNTINSPILDKEDDKGAMANRIWDIIINDLDVFKTVMNDPALFKSYRESSSKYCLIFKPTMNIVLFELIYKAIKVNKVDRLIKYLNETDFSISKKWENIIIDSIGKVIPRNKDLIIKTIAKKVNLN